VLFSSLGEHHLLAHLVKRSTSKITLCAADLRTNQRFCVTLTNPQKLRATDWALSRLQGAQNVPRVAFKGACVAPFLGIERVPALAVSWIDGASLQDILLGAPLGLDPATVLQWHGALHRTLVGMHLSGVIHGNICPAHVIIGRAGTPYLVDFSTALPTSSLGFSLSYGLFRWAAPNGRVTKKCDDESLALVMLCALIGHQRFVHLRTADCSKVGPQAAPSQKLAEVLRLALSPHDPAERSDAPT
jgi:hypothetical protein